MTAYTALANTYNSQLKLWNTENGRSFSDFLTSPKKTIVIPKRPVPPTKPETYDGLYLWDDVSAKNTNNIFVSGADQGGWGMFTMGLLIPSAEMEKSYGTFGMDKSVTEQVGPPKVNYYDA